MLCSIDRVMFLVLVPNIAVESSGIAPMRDLNRVIPWRKRQFDQYATITRKRCEIWFKLVLCTIRKSHTGFRSLPKSITLSDLERPNGCHYALFHATRQFSKPTASNWLKLCAYRQRQKHGPRSIIFGNIWFMETTRAISAVAELLVRLTGNKAKLQKS